MVISVRLSLLFLLLLHAGCATHEPNTHAENNTTKTKITPFSTAKEEIKSFQKHKRKKMQETIPPLVLPSPFEDISVFAENKITLSANDAKLTFVLYTLAKSAGLNLIIDEDVLYKKVKITQTEQQAISDGTGQYQAQGSRSSYNSANNSRSQQASVLTKKVSIEKIPRNLHVTINVKNANLEDVLKTLMETTGAYYDLEGNILHVKYFKRKTFQVPYVHTATSFKTDLGGDVFSSATSGGSSSSGGGSTSSALRGDFSLHYDNPQKNNSFYVQLEKNIKDLISQEGHYTLNKFTGTLSVYDNYKSIKQIENLIERLKNESKKQILIEAKILEVILNKSHELGVSWEAIAQNVLKTGNQLTLNQNLALTGAVAGSVTYSSDSFNAIINALDQAGNIDALSNPRIKVLSGQSAIISSGKLVPYWEKEVQTLQGTGGSASNTQITYNRRDVLDGLTLGVTPVLLDDDKIMLNIIPITSNIQKDINYYDEEGRIVATAPLLNIKEAGTVVYAKDNDLVLIGGLINNRTLELDQSVPFLGDIPFVGALFKHTYKKNEKRELVILLRLRIIR